MTLLRWVGIATLAASFPLATLLPAWTGFENGPIENTQVAILSIGAGMALVFAEKDRTTTRWFWCAVAPIWLTMCLRELSWGAVFLPALSITDHGPQFSSSLLWYKPYVKPALIAVLVLTVAAFIKGGGLGVSWRLTAARRIPFADITLFGIGVAIASAAEGHLGVNLGDWGEMLVIEETAELAAYIFLISAQANVWIALQALCAEQSAAMRKALMT